MSADPTQQVVALFAEQTNPSSNERLHEITCQLRAFYKEPSAIPIIFNIIQNVPAVKQQAIIGYKGCIQESWNCFFCATNEQGAPIRVAEREQVKAAIAGLIPCLELQAAKLFIDYSEPVFRTDAANWEALFAMLGAMTDTPEHIQVGAYLIASIAQWLDDVADFRTQSLPTFFQFGQGSIAIGTEEAIIIGAGALGVAISYTPPELIGGTQELFGQLLTILPAALKATDEMSCEVAKAIGDACQADALPMPAGQVMGFLTTCLGDAEVPPEHYKDIFIVVNELVGWHADELSGATADILMMIIQVIERVDNPDPGCLLADNDDTNAIAEAAEFLAHNVEDVNFFKILKSLDNPTAPVSRQFAYLLVFTRSIDQEVRHIMDDVTESMSWVCQFLVRNIQAPIPKIRELALWVVRDVCKLFKDDQVDMATHLFENVLGCFPDPNPHMCITCLETMVDLLNEATINSSVIEKVLTVCKSILDDPSVGIIHPHAFEVISSLIWAVEDDIVPYAQTVFPLILAGCNVSDEMSLIKQYAITALGNLIRFAPAPLESVLPQSVQLIFQSCMSEDPNIKNDAVSALGALILAKCPLVVAGKVGIIQIIESYFNNDLFSAEIQDDESQDGVVANEPTIVGFQSILYLIKVIFKYYRELCPDDAENFGKWVAIFQTFMRFPGDDFQKPAISAGLYCCLATKDLAATTPQFGTWIMEYISILCEIIQETESVTVANKCFRCFRILIENEVANEAQITMVVQAGLTSLDGNLPFQKSDEFEASSSDQVYKLLSLVFLKFPQICPIKQLLDHGKKVIAREERYFELSHYVSMLENCYVNSDAMGSIVKNMLIKTFVTAFQKYTSLFEEGNDGTAFCSYPSPVSALRTVIEKDPGNKEVQQFVGPVMQFLGVIMQAGYSGETYYHATMTNAIAFLCSMIRLSPDAFDYGTWLPLMINHLPLKSDEKTYGEAIYSTLLTVFTSKGLFGQDMNVFKCLARTLGLKDRFFTMLSLSEQTEGGLKQLVGQMITAGQMSAEVLQSCFDDQQSFARFQGRLSG